MVFLQGCGVHLTCGADLQEVRLSPWSGPSRTGWPPMCGHRLQGRRYHRRGGRHRPDSPERIKAGLAYTLSEAVDEGHCYLPAPNLVAGAAKILEVPAEMITPVPNDLHWWRWQPDPAAIRRFKPRPRRPAPASPARRPLPRHHLPSRPSRSYRAPGPPAPRDTA
jgi:hypothetical protein